MRSWDENPIVQLSLWRVREFLREPEALFWVFAFPIVLAVALGLAFKNRGPDAVRIAVENGPGADALVETLREAPRIEAQLLESEEAAARLRTGRVALVVRPAEPVALQFDSTRSESFVARLLVEAALQRAAGQRDPREIRDQPVSERGRRYIDFLIPGLLGMNIMGTGLWGLGFGIVKSRQLKLLKRFIASPMRRSHFMLGHMFARLTFLTIEVGSVLAFGHLVFGVPIRGSFLAILAIVALGALTFAGVGLLVASRARTTEGVSGLMNLVMVPMWICSGVFFAYSNFPEAMQPFIQALPLTALNDALRAVILDGEPLVSTIGWLGIVGAWGVASFGVALKLFRWN